MKPPASAPLLIPATLMISLLITGLLTWQTSLSSRQRAEAELAIAARRLATDVVQRLQLYQYGLRGARGTIITAGEHGITRELFVRYSQTRDIALEFPGARGFGFIRRVTPEQVPAFIERVRADGWPDYSVRQLQPHDGERYLIEYIEPVRQNLAAIGLDIASEANRREAALKAITTGETQLTGPITLVQATGHPLQSFLVLMPIYRNGLTPRTAAERETAGFGWSYAALLTEDVFADLHIKTRALHLTVQDITESAATPPSHTPFYNSDPDLDVSQQRYPQQLERTLFGRHWLLTVSATPDFIHSLGLPSPRQRLLQGVAASVGITLLAGLIASLRKRKRQISESTAQLAAITESSPDAIAATDLDGHITHWNKGAETIFGYSSAEALGRIPSELLLPHGQISTLREVLLKIRSGRTMPPNDTRLRCKDGRLIESRVIVTPIINKQQRLSGIAICIRDITQEKATEAKILTLNAKLEARVNEHSQDLQKILRENKSLLKTINRQMLYSVCDNRGVIVEANDNFCDSTGYDRAELLGQTHRLLSSGVHDHAFWHSMWATICRGQVWQGEICNRHKDGSLHWFDTVIAPIIKTNGEAERFVALRTDITSHKQTEVALRQSNSLLNNVLRSATTFCIIATDVDGLVTIFNDGAERILGYAAHDVIGKHALTFFHDPSELNDFSQQLSAEAGIQLVGLRALVYRSEQEGVDCRQWTYMRKNGERIQVELTISTLRDAEQAINGYLGIAQNISST